MGRTLYEILKTRLGPAAELQVYNPLKLRLGTVLTIDALDYRGYEFKVVGINEWLRTIEGKAHRFVDYDLGDYQFLDAPLQMRLRLNPLADPDPVSGLTHSTLLLSLYYECGHKDAVDTGLIKGVNADTGEFEIDWNGKRTYYRIHDLRTPHLATVKSLSDTDGNGMVDSDEITETQTLYWDYHTELTNEANQKYVEYLFVEQDKDNGWWQIWRGTELNPEQVTVAY